jgi:thiol-disulfide isomerase/thioredoxin
MRRRTVLALLGAAAVVPGVAARAAKPAQGLLIHDQPRAIPALDIRDGENRPTPLATWRGKAVLLNLWASWCGPCVAELPTLDRLKPLVEPEGVAVVALSLDRSGKTAVVNTFARLGIRNLDIHTDEARRAAEELGAPYLPVTLLIDRDGREAARFVGPAEWDGPPARALLKALADGRRLDMSMAPGPPPKGLP